MSFSRALLAGTLFASLVPAAASAADYRVRVGAGVQSRPDFPGAGSNGFSFYPEVSVAKQGELFGVGAPDDSFDIKLLSSGGLSAGPVAAFGSGRKRSDVDLPLDKVPTTFEAGAFVQMMAGESFRLRGELRKGLGGHGGLVGHAGADYVARDGDAYTVTVGPRVRFSNARYQREYFGVSPAAALATGLPAYDPGGGVHAVGAIGSMTYSLGGAWGLFGYARYDRLVGDARKSPIVRQLGSPNQYSGGLGLSYAFDLSL